jgi:general secretion pathway protein C
MGLQNGDILTGVNGKKIESVDDALALYQNIKENDTVTVELKRRGNTEVISYQIK